MGVGAPKVFVGIAPWPLPEVPDIPEVPDMPDMESPRQELSTPAPKAPQPPSRMARRGKALMYRHPRPATWTVPGVRLDGAWTAPGLRSVPGGVRASAATPLPLGKWSAEAAER